MKNKKIWAGIILAVLILFGLFYFIASKEVVAPVVPEVETVDVEQKRPCAIDEPITDCVCKGKVENNICKDPK